MIWIEHSPQARREMAGSHPFLVLSPRAFNEKTGLVIGCAMTGRQARLSNNMRRRYRQRSGARPGYAHARHV